MEEIDFGEWWTAPAESENGQLIMVTGRDDIKKFRSNSRFKIRIEVTWPYADALPDGMPNSETAAMIGEITDRFQECLKKDPVAVLTGMFTGAGERNWIFYAISTNIFQKKLNEVLDPFPLLPLEIVCENDPQWEQYDEMTEARIEE